MYARYSATRAASWVSVLTSILPPVAIPCRAGRKRNLCYHGPRGRRSAVAAPAVPTQKRQGGEPPCRVNAYGVASLQVSDQLDNRREGRIDREWPQLFVADELDVPVHE